MEIEKKYYSIGEVAKRFKVATSLIRFWETQFDNISPKKNKNGVRQYTKDDIKCIEEVYELVKKKGYTLQGAQTILNKQSASDKLDLINKLKETKTFLQQLREQLS